MKVFKTYLITFLFVLVSISAIHAESQLELTFQAHVQYDGWLSSVPIEKTVGTIGESKNLEAFSIYSNTGEIKYSSHVATIGWQETKCNGQESGTTGQGLAIEAIKIELDNNLSEDYDIYYRVHTANIGWLDWAKNGQEAGTVGLGLPAQAFEVKLVAKDTVLSQNTQTPLITADAVKQLDQIDYKAHCAGLGWQDTRSNGMIAGTQGEMRSIEALTITMPDINRVYSNSSIEYEVHGQDYGWQGYVSQGQTAGTVGLGLPLQAVRIRLTGMAGVLNDIYYRVHVTYIGWLDWAKNGSEAGTTGLNLPIEAFEVIVVPKGYPAPGSIDYPYFSSESLNAMSATIDASMENIGWMDTIAGGNIVGAPGSGLGIEALKISVPNLGGNSGIVYNLHLENIGWQGEFANSEIAGTTGQNLQAEAISIRLTGTISLLFDVYYQVCSKDVGWLGWASNNQLAGTSNGDKSMEAFRIWLVPKGNPAPVYDEVAYKVIENKITADQVPNFNLICAIVQHEGGDSYEGALAVMSCVMNRCDSGRWGGKDPVSVLTAPGQFSSYLDGYYRQFLNNPSPTVQQAVLDCLNGKRSHGYESFRAYPVSGSVNIGGNWFF